MSRFTRWSVPGSILLAGEYRITEDGGLGLAVAAGARVDIRWRSSTSLSILGRWPGGQSVWSPKGIDDEGLPNEGLQAELYRLIEEELGFASIRASGFAVLDTSKFGDIKGKWGLGSSAAAALLGARFLLPTAGSDDVLRIALRAHRRFQGGRGSGYDLLTAFHGGVGIFGGGQLPTWSSVNWPEQLHGCLIRGPSPVQSPKAVARFETWVSESPGLWTENQQIIDAGINACRKTLENGGELDFLARLRELAEIGVEIGEKIGVEARPVLPEGLKSLTSENRTESVAKCVGAGNELAVLLYLDGGLSHKETTALDLLIEKQRALPLNIDLEGLREEKGV